MLPRAVLHLLTLTLCRGLLIRQVPAELFYDTSHGARLALLGSLDFSQPRVRETLPRLLKGRLVPFSYIWPEVPLGAEQARSLVENFIDCSREVQHLVLSFVRVFDSPSLRDALRPHLAKYHPDRIEWLRGYPECADDLDRLLPRLVTNPRLCGINIMQLGPSERLQVLSHLVYPFLGSTRLNHDQNMILQTLTTIVLERKVAISPTDLEPARSFKESMHQLMSGPLHSEEEESALYGLIDQQIQDAASVFGAAGQAVWTGLLLDFYTLWPHRIFKGLADVTKLTQYLEHYHIDDMPHFAAAHALGVAGRPAYGIERGNQIGKWYALAEKYPDFYSPVKNNLLCHLPHWRYVLLQWGMSKNCRFTQRIRAAAAPMEMEEIVNAWAEYAPLELDRIILAGNPTFRPPLQVHFRGGVQSCANLSQLLPLLTDYLWTDRLGGTLLRIDELPESSKLLRAFARTLAANVLHLASPLFPFSAVDLEWLETKRLFYTTPRGALIALVSSSPWSSQFLRKLTTPILTSPSSPSRWAQLTERALETAETGALVVLLMALLYLLCQLLMILEEEYWQLPY